MSFYEFFRTPSIINATFVRINPISPTFLLFFFIFAFEIILSVSKLTEISLKFRSFRKGLRKKLNLLSFAGFLD